MGDRNVLYTTPTGEHITARRSTRAKFLQLESSQFHSYVSDLESSLHSNKALLKDLIASVKSKTPIDKLTLTRILRSFEEENANIEERIRLVTIEKNDAAMKAENSERVIAEIVAREMQSSDPHERKLRKRREELEEIEGKVQEVDRKCNELLGEVEEAQRLAEARGVSQTELDLTMTEKYVRLKTIYEKLLKELDKSMKAKDEIEISCRGLLGDLRRVNSVLKLPISRSRDLEEVFRDIDLCPPLENLPIEDAEDEEKPPPQYLTRHIEALKTQQHKKTLSQRITAPVGNFASQNEQKLALENEKLVDKIKDAAIKLETLQEEIAASTRLNVLLQQDNFRLTAALDGLQRKKKTLELPGGNMGVPKGKHVVTHSQVTVGKKQKRRGRASSNPLEYLDNSEVVQPYLQTARGARPAPEPSDHEDDVGLCDSMVEMPSIIGKLEGDEFLLGDSFLADALSLQNRP